ncbi:sirohydrochlorin cobaltochelatase [Clostridium sardiniense]|uniref:sirohydrochlorin cobaltochelatase n=1 Tax=Clostridium sardiniense TaxID=29369 RepID=UPI003D32AFDE
MDKKKAIVIVAFGTAKDAGFNKYLLPFKKDVEEKYGEKFDCFFALTSKKMLSKLSLDVKSYEDTLEELKMKNYDEVYVETLYFSKGKEYSKVEEVTNKYINSFEIIKITKPILEENKNLIDEYFNKYDNILFICHGVLDSEESLEEEYIKSAIKEKSKGQSYVALINKQDDYKNVISNIKDDNIPKVTIVPILITKGYHFKKDIIAESKESFLGKLKNEDITVEVVDKSLGENRFFRQVVLESLDKIIEEVGESLE